MLTDLDLETSFIYFGEEVLGLPLYDWQCRAIEPFDGASEKLTLVSLATPNGSGKSSFVIPTLVLGWLAMFPKGRVVLTTADGRQLDSQVMPAINSHRSKFPEWKFIDRQVHTPTGGQFVAFTTDNCGRAEGWHKLDDIEGPLLVIVDEAKSVPEDIFSAIDRCTYNAILLTSSPGRMAGTFYDSQFKPELGYIPISVGLKDCPHITQDKIDRIVAKHGPNSPFTRSALHGEFIEIFDGDPVYYAYNAQVHEFDHLPWPHGALLAVGMDVGTHNASVIAAVKEDKAKRLHVWLMREIILTGSDTDRQCVELLKVLANELPFWNTGTPVCPQSLFYCDPAARNSSFTSRGPNASALKVIHSHGIFPGMKIGLGLQPSIATVNRLLQQNFLNGEKTTWQFHINKAKCPVLADAMRGRYMYPAQGQAGYGSDMPLKGNLCQHVDHVCLCAGTLITTARGNVPIEAVAVGDLAWTRKGWKPVIASALTSPAAELWELRAGGTSIIGTEDHPIWIENFGWKKLASCIANDRVTGCKPFDSPDATSTSTETATTRAGVEKKPDTCTERFGSRLMGKFRMAWSFITGTGIEQTTPSKTSNASLQNSTHNAIGMRWSQATTNASTVEVATRPSPAIRQSSAPNCASTSIGSSPELITLSSTAPPDADRSCEETNTNWEINSARNARARGVERAPSGNPKYAQTAAVFLNPNHPTNLHDSAHVAAFDKPGERAGWTTSNMSAVSAGKNSWLTRMMTESIALTHAPTKLGIRRPVYNITVEDAHEYIANGILVSNCDAARYAVCNVLDIAPEEHNPAMRNRNPAVGNPEPRRSI